MIVCEIVFVVSIYYQSFAVNELGRLVLSTVFDGRTAWSISCAVTKKTKNANPFDIYIAILSIYHSPVLYYNGLTQLSYFLLHIVTPVLNIYSKFRRGHAYGS